MKQIEFELSQSSVLKALKQLDKELSKTERLLSECCRRLAKIGYQVAKDGLDAAVYDGDKNYTIEIVHEEDGYAIIAQGQSVLFMEFGAGIRYGHGHPEPQGFGPGTYHGHGRWKDPHGWWYWDGGQWQHTYGNPPSMAFYHARQAMLLEVYEVMREVFK